MAQETQEPHAGDGAGLSQDERLSTQSTQGDNSAASAGNQAHSPAVQACIDRNARRLSGGPGLAAKEASVELLIDEIGDCTAAMIVALHVVLAHRDARDPVGLVYGLCRVRAYWRAIAGSTAELVAAEAERLSILRQREDAP